MTLHSIQLLRFLAAAAVTFHHVVREVHLRVGPLPEPMRRLAEAGASGVHIFFVISGFIMVWTCRDTFGRPGQVGPFLKRRAIRVFPIYWLLGTVNLAFSPANGPQDVSQFLLAAGLVPGYATLLIFVGWTLSYELFFYVTFAALLPLRRPWALLTLTGLFACLCGARALVPTSSPIAAMLTSPLLLEFVAGAWIAVALDRGIRGPSWGGQALLSLGVLGFAASVPLQGGGLPNVVLWGAPSILVVAGALAMEANKPLGRLLRATSRLGDSSYALYLLHAMIVPAVAFHLNGLYPGPEWLNWLSSALLLVLCVAGAHGVYLRLEQPLVNTVKVWLSPSPAARRAESR